MGKPHVLIIPFPAQGHVIPTMELAQRLVKEGVKVTFVNTEATQKVITNNWLKNDDFENLMQMVSIPDGLEPCEDRNDIAKVMKSIKQFMPDKLEELIDLINKQSESKITCIIADCTMGWAMRVATKMGIRRAAFWPSSVNTMATMLCFRKLIDDGIINQKGELLKDEMIHLSETVPPVKSAHLWWTCFEDLALAEASFQIVVEAVETAGLTEWFLCNSTIELEAAVFTWFPQLLPIGPLLASNRLAEQRGHFWQEDHTCIEWLDQQPACSVIYIAFGSSTIFNQTQFKELAIGIELSNRPFLWVVRPDMTNDTTTAYPDGYMDRVGTRGRIVSWAPQQKVLAHPSIACFMSHCGWNSTLECVTNGIPFLCCPYFADQFLNTAYICDIWKTGLGFNKDEAGIVTRGEIKSKIDQLLSNNIFRANALVMKESVAITTRKGGCAHTNLGNFIKWIQKIDMEREFLEPARYDVM